MHIIRSVAVLALSLTTLAALPACSAQSPESAFLERVRADTDAGDATDAELLGLGEEMCTVAEGLDGDELEAALDQMVSMVDDPEMATNVTILSVHALAHLCPEQGQKLTK